MDLLPLSLARRLEVLPRLPEADVVRLALDVAAALTIAHGDGVVHRDIKPDNVLLGPNGEAIVADFGLARAFTGTAAESEINQVMGTPHYFSPEQARGLEVDGRADLYALGVTCYRAATGRVPFEGDDWYTVAKQHIEDAVVPPRELVPQLSEGFEAIVMRLLAKSPDQRFASATQLADALLMLASAPSGRNSGSMRTPGATTQINTPFPASISVTARRRKWWRAAAVGGGAIVAGAALWLTLPPNTRAAELWAQLRGDTLSSTPMPVSSAATVLPSAPTTVPVDSPGVRPNASAGNAAGREPTKTARDSVGHVRNPNSIAAPTTVHVELSASDSSAQLYVNEQRVSRGHWAGDVPVGKLQRFRASIEPSPALCTSSTRDTTVTVDARTVSPQRIPLTVVPCGRLVLMQPEKKAVEADYTIKGLTAPFKSDTGHLPVKSKPIVLPYGRYAISAHAERCFVFGDTIVMEFTPRDTVFKMITFACN